MIAWLLACMPDDYAGPYSTFTQAPTADTGAGVATEGGLVGAWRSEGADLSALFSADPFAYQRVDTTFSADGTYTVDALDGDGNAWPITGTYTVDVTVAPATIALVQQTPYEAEAEGIWSVSGDTLTYEVVQTLPDYGFRPPTPERGFGSTTGPGLAPGANVQTYQRLAGP